MKGIKAVVAIMVAVVLTLLTGFALFGDFGAASAAMARATQAQIAQSTPDTQAEDTRMMPVYEEEDPIVSPEPDKTEKTQAEDTYVHADYDPMLYYEAAQMINAQDDETFARLAEEQKAAEAAAQQIPAWTTYVPEEEYVYTPPAEDACIGDGLTY